MAASSRSAELRGLHLSDVATVKPKTPDLQVRMTKLRMRGRAAVCPPEWLGYLEGHEKQAMFLSFHDLTHFAVETMLGFRQVFCGLIPADGRSLIIGITRNAVISQDPPAPHESPEAELLETCRCRNCSIKLSGISIVTLILFTLGIILAGLSKQYLANPDAARWQPKWLSHQSNSE